MAFPMAAPRASSYNTERSSTVTVARPQVILVGHLMRGDRLERKTAMEVVITESFTLCFMSLIEARISK